MREYLIYEVIAIGLLTVLFTFTIYYLFNGKLPNSSTPQFNQMILGTFLVGALIHLSLEFSGMNEKWCKFTYKI